MRPKLATILFALAAAAGCAAPEPAADPEDGPIDLTGRYGLLAIDVERRAVQVLSDTSTLAWISPGGAFVFWNEESFGVALNASTGAREVAPSSRFARIYDNGTVLELREGQAVWRSILGGNTSATAPLPAPPVAGSRWIEASDDLRVLGVEYPAQGTCQNDLFVRADESARSRGCHLRVAGDGRAGWTIDDHLFLRASDGSTEEVEPANGTREENPIFTAEGHLFLRLHGGAVPDLAEVVSSNGTVVAHASAPTRLALQGATADGGLLLVGAFR